MTEFHGVVAAKGAGLEWRGQIDAWVSLHPERMALARAERAKRGYPAAKLHIGHHPKLQGGDEGIDKYIQYKFPGQKLSGSSGLFAVKVALEDLGFDLAVMCGIPLLKEGGRIDYVGDKEWNGASAFHSGFQQAIPAFRDRVRSMSGWTAIKVGTPTPSWLQVEG